LKGGLAEMIQLIAALEASLSTAETQIEKLHAAIEESKALKEKENEKRDQQGGPHRSKNHNKDRNTMNHNRNRNRGSNNNRSSFQYNYSNRRGGGGGGGGGGMGGWGRGNWPGGGGGSRHMNPGHRYEEDGKGLERAVKLLQEEMGGSAE